MIRYYLSDTRHNLVYSVSKFSIKVVDVDYEDRGILFNSKAELIQALQDKIDELTKELYK